MLVPLQYGWNADLDIPAAVAKYSVEQDVASLVLVSMLDSTPKVSTLPSLVPLLTDRETWHETVDDDVVIEFSTLVELIDKQDVLCGFDEIWLCSELPSSGKPEHLRITSDTPLRSELPAGLAEWMLASSCHTGLGDGDGLNFVTLDPALAAVWR